MSPQRLSVQPYKGARDFYPDEMRLQNYLYDTWKKVCSSFGFEQYDFPLLEPFEIFSAKTGEEIVNEQIFSLEDKGGRKLAVRPELTPGTVRMLAQRYKDLPKPIKWFMIGNNWRFEKPQLGRGREFYQLEANIFGVEDISADFEIFTLIIAIMKAFKATSDMFEIRVSDRRLVNALLETDLKLEPEKQVKVRRLMDKSTKMDKKEFLAGLDAQKLTSDQLNKIKIFLSSTLDNLSLAISPEILQSNAGYQGILQLFRLLKENGLEEYVKFDPSIIRGFDYSDGLVYEVFDKNPQNRRSIFGGERFDKLIRIFGNYEMPATGFALGDYTLTEFLKGWNLLLKPEPKIDYFITLWPEKSEKYLPISLEIAGKLRDMGKKVFTWMQPEVKLDKQLKYADKKGVKNALIVGEEELKNNSITVKEMNTGNQENISLENFLSNVS